jgi:hypothetical protein
MVRVMFTLLREYYPEATTGTLLNEKGERLCSTLELPWIDNKQYVSCIPEGIYHVKKYSSTKWPDVWQIMNVVDRTNILIHWGNKVSTKRELSDVEGCILVGNKLKTGVLYEKILYPYWVTDSKNTIKKLRTILPTAFLLEIRR